MVGFFRIFAFPCNKARGVVCDPTMLHGGGCMPLVLSAQNDKRTHTQQLLVCKANQLCRGRGPSLHEMISRFGSSIVRWRTPLQPVGGREVLHPFLFQLAHKTGY